jgi:hypothetical protein
MKWFSLNNGRFFVSIKYDAERLPRSSLKCTNSFFILHSVIKLPRIIDICIHKGNKRQQGNHNQISKSVQISATKNALKTFKLKSGPQLKKLGY